MSELGDDYASAGFGAALEFGPKPVLLIIDFVRAYLEKDSPLYAGIEDALFANQKLAALARAKDVPVIWTRVGYDGDGFDGRENGMFRRKVPALACFDRGNPLGEFDPRLSPEPGDMVMLKQYPSAFFGTHLASTLTAMRVDTVIISGLSTSGCVRASALDALCHGFAPFVVRDACGDRDQRVHEANLFDMQAKCAEVVDLEWIGDRLKS